MQDKKVFFNNSTPFIHKEALGNLAVQIFPRKKIKTKGKKRLAHVQLAWMEKAKEGI